MRPATRKTRFVCVSDTHGDTVELPKGDVLIHCGDLTNFGDPIELAQQLEWLEKTDFECKLLVAGNHDLTLDGSFWQKHSEWSGNASQHDECVKLVEEASSITYLNHESRIIKLSSPSGPQTTFSIFASPLSLDFGGWAFQYQARDAAKVWSSIPLDSDIVVAHGPPHTHRDRVLKEVDGALMPVDQAGCEELRKSLWRVRPKLALCGHIHEARGVEFVYWNLSNKDAFAEEGTEVWDATTTKSNDLATHLDLTDTGARPLRNDGSIASLTDYSWPERGSGVGAESDSNGSVVLDEPALTGRLGRKETCIVNCAIQARGYGQKIGPKLNKPIVIDIDLPL